MARPQMRGPGGRRGMMGGKRSKNPKKTLGRLMKYIQKGYGVQCTVCGRTDAFFCRLWQTWQAPCSSKA